MNEADILKFRTRLIGRSVVIRERTASTNSDAKALAARGCVEGTLVVAEEQTAGRGRLGRTWHSEPGKGLAFSFVLRPDLPPDRLGVLSLIAGLSASRAVSRTVRGTAPLCKWPNDLLLDGKKFCGILAESTGGTFPAVVIGIGMNVNERKFPAAIAQTATSLRIAAGRETDRPALLGAILEELDAAYAELRAAGPRPLLDAWSAASGMIGSRVAVERDGKTLRGRAAGIADDGGLLIEAGGKTTKVVAGEVTLAA